MNFRFCCYSGFQAVFTEALPRKWSYFMSTVYPSSNGVHQSESAAEVLGKWFSKGEGGEFYTRKPTHLEFSRSKHWLDE
jgi:hypothetical protein